MRRWRYEQPCGNATRVRRPVPGAVRPVISTSSSSKAGTDDRLARSNGSETKAASISKRSSCRSMARVVPVCSSIVTSGNCAWKAARIGGSRAPAALSSEPSRRTPRTTPLRSSCSARSAIRSSASAWPRRVRPASVRVRPRPSRRNRATPSRASNCLIRVVTLDGTRCSIAAARVTPPSRTTQRKMSRSSRSIVLIRETYVTKIHFPRMAGGVQRGRHEHSPTRPDRFRTHTLAGRRQRPRRPGGRHGHRALRVHAPDAADDARRHPHGRRGGGMGRGELRRVSGRRPDGLVVRRQSAARAAPESRRRGAHHGGDGGGRPRRTGPSRGRIAGPGRRVQRLGPGLCQRLVPGRARPAPGRRARRLDLYRRRLRHRARRHAGLARRDPAGVPAVARAGAGRRLGALLVWSLSRGRVRKRPGSGSARPPPSSGAPGTARRPWSCATASSGSATSCRRRSCPPWPASWPPTQRCSA